MDWPVVVVQWLHVALGIFWFGGTLFANLVVIPVIMTLPNDRQVPVFNAITARATGSSRGWPLRRSSWG